ncbi:MAG: hypothetical protein R3F53_05310 [Gammaproteobacteria bacterium]
MTLKKFLNLEHAATQLTQQSAEPWSVDDVLIACGQLPICIIVHTKCYGRLVWVQGQNDYARPHDIMSYTPRCQVNGVLQYDFWRVRPTGPYRIDFNAALTLRQSEAVEIKTLFITPNNELGFLSSVRAKRPEVPADARIVIRLDEPLQIHRSELLIPAGDLQAFLGRNIEPAPPVIPSAMGCPQQDKKTQWLANCATAASAGDTATRNGYLQRVFEIYYREHNKSKKKAAALIANDLRQFELDISSGLIERNVRVSPTKKT